MERLKIKLHPLFAIYVFVCIYFNWINLIFYYIVVMFLHEFAHYFVAKRLGYNVDGFLLSAYGIGMQTNNSYRKKDEILISIAGPIFNLILIILTVFLWWVYPSMYFFTYDFVMCNFLVMVFNMIPLYPLDGGRVIVCLFSRFNKKKVLKVSNMISIILGVILMVLFFISIFTRINLNLLFIGLFLTINSISCDRNNYYNQINALNKKYEKPVEIKTFVVKGLRRGELIKYLSPHYYSIFEYYDNGNKYIISEDDLMI